MLITQCGWRLRHRCALMQGLLWQGFVAAKNHHLFGQRLHFATNLLSVVDRWLLAPTSLDERAVMPHLVSDDVSRFFLAESNYISSPLERDLFLDCGHHILALRRRDQKGQWPEPLRHLATTLRRWSGLDTTEDKFFVEDHRQ